MFSEMPDGWPAADPSTIDAALAHVHDALDDEATLIRRLSAYYRTDGDYAGATFLDLNPNDPASVSPSDLLAVTTLSVDIPPRAVRRLIEPSADATRSTVCWAPQSWTLPSTC